MKAVTPMDIDPQYLQLIAPWLVAGDPALGEGDGVLGLALSLTGSGGGGGGVPANAIRDRAGNPILDRTGNSILSRV